MSEDRDTDVVVHGATGFVGRLVAQYLAEHAGPDVRVGLAGRSADRLAAVRASLGPRAAEWPLIVADASDAAALADLAGSTRVVASTVGPYRAYGMELVRACAEAGTHYADLTGEVLFMRETIDAFHAVAQASGARIVHSCGFDSIPSDLGVLLLSEAARARGAGELEETTLIVRGLGGGLSGGTLASMTGQLDEMRGDRALARVAADPYALSPDREAEPDLGDEGDLRTVDRVDGRWVAPFVMAGVNTRAVRRSNALQGWAYGRRFRYREVLGVGGSPLAPFMAGAVAGGVGALMAGLSFGPSRAVLDRVLPSPGEGPDEEARRKGYFKIEIVARTSAGARLRARISAQGDPGYAATSVMLGESALCLALDADRVPDRAGVLTPATAMGTALVDRLRAAGQTYEVEPA
jgi:short subunit dehydrogenase-like uncharacterized protein